MSLRERECDDAFVVACLSAVLGVSIPTHFVYLASGLGCDMGLIAFRLG